MTDSQLGGELGHVLVLKLLFLLARRVFVPRDARELLWVIIE